MAYQLRELQGSLFTNQRKLQEKHPDFTGSILIGGVEYRLSGWSRTSQSGQQYVSLAAQVQQQGQYQQGGYQQQQMPQQMQQGFQQTGQFPSRPVNNPQYQQGPQPQYQQQQPVQQTMQAPVQQQMPQQPMQQQPPQGASVPQGGGKDLPF